MNEATLAATIILSIGVVLVALVTVALHGRGTKLDDQSRESPKGASERVEVG